MATVQKSPAVRDVRMDESLETHLPLLRGLAAQMIVSLRPYLEMDDLVAIGMEALLRAAPRFEPGRGISFGSFAYLRVRGAMYESVGAIGPLPRGVIRRRKGRPESRNPARGPRGAPRWASAGSGDHDARREIVDAIDHARLGRRLHHALDSLTESHRQLILRHYFGGDSLDAIGRQLGRSRSWACRAHARALAGLRSALEPAPA